MNPLVSIVIPTKNSEKFIGCCLESVKDQTYQNLEIIVVDNNSTDRTKEIAKKHADKIFNYGPERSAQRNFGAKNCTGEYMVFIDSDMKLSRKVILSCVEKIKENKSIKGIVIPEESFGEGFWAECKKLEKSFYVGIDWMEGARFFDKKAFWRAGGYDENMISGEDWDLSQKVAEKNKIGRIGEFIFHNEGRVSLSKILAKKFYYAKNFCRYTDKEKNKNHLKKQTGIIGRYKLFFSKPERLLDDSLIGIGMLLMKTCEFGFGGAGYLMSKITR